MTKNILILLSIFILFGSNLIAQNITIKDVDNNDITGGSITVQGVPSDNLLELPLKITNNSGSAIDVKVKKEEISIVTGSENYFCWGSCYTPDVTVSVDFITIDAGATDSHGFTGDYKPKGNEGETSIRYTFFDMNNTSDEAVVTVKYNASNSTKITTVKNEGYISKVFPVPATNFANIQYNFTNATSIKLKIYNLQGIKIEEIIINKKNGKYELKNYKQGIYLYKFLQKGKVLNSGKFIFQ